MGKLRKKSSSIQRPKPRYYTGGNTTARVRWWWAQRDEILVEDDGALSPHTIPIRPPAQPDLYNPGIGVWMDDKTWSDDVNWRD